ncbi:MAG: energy transducer TonB [Bacteroidales bacterium]|nr:energy transducer TonB [Bacteroidales bacterium]
MEAKKTNKANLESKKALFLQVGLIVALCLIIYAFEYKSYQENESFVMERQVVRPLDDIVLTIQEDTPPLPPEKVPTTESTEFLIVDDDIIIKNEYKITNLIVDGNIGATIKKIEIKDDDEKVHDDENTPFKIVEEEAEFPGGYGKLIEYLAKSIQYPQQALETGTKGGVMLTFVVEKDGSITDIKVIRDIGSGCGQEAIRVVKEMPKWKPAKQRGKVVRQQFVLPVSFDLK